MRSASRISSCSAPPGNPIPFVARTPSLVLASEDKEEGEGGSKSGNPRRFRRARSLIASSSSRLIRDSSAKRRRFSSRARALVLSSSSILRF